MKKNTPTSMRFLPITVATALMAATGCQMTPWIGEQAGPEKPTGPIKAVWVTRFDFKTPDDISNIMENSKQAGFNMVVFQIRGNGTVFYPSKIEPWSEQFEYKSPGFDPLEVAVREARARGLQLHAWMNVMPAWRGTTPPTNPDQLYNKHPEWFWYDQQGKRQALTTFYVSLNPCLPEVRSYLTELFREVAANYDVDGIHMDYIRFPSEAPAIPAGSGIDYPYDAKTLALYKEATGKAPDDDRQAWNKWRADQVTQLVSDLHSMLRATRPRAALAASVGNNAEQSLRFFRDELRWAREGLIDQAYPMNYRPNLETFKDGVAMWLPLRETITVVPGLWFDPRQQAEPGAQVVKAQIEYASEVTGNFCVFSYASLFDSRDRLAAVSTQPVSSERAERARKDRETRRKIVIPVVQTIKPLQSQPAA